MFFCFHSGPSLDKEFIVHANILARMSPAMKGFLEQPQNQKNSLQENEMRTLILPPHLNQKIAIQFFICIYHLLMPSFPKGNLQTFNANEFRVILDLCEMYLIEEKLKFFIYDELKRKCKNVVILYFPEKERNIKESYKCLTR